MISRKVVNPQSAKSGTDQQQVALKSNTDTPSPSTTKAVPVSQTKQIVENDSTVETSLPTVGALRGYCVVGLKNRQFQPGKPEFSSVFEDRTYYFSSVEAKVEFDLAPENYAPAYAGIDPVEWLQKREMVEGTHLREFEGRFFLFKNQENWEAFKTSPQRLS